MLSRKCLASESALSHNLWSWGGVSSGASSTFPPRQQKPGVSYSNFFAVQFRRANGAHGIQEGAKGVQGSAEATVRVGEGA
jgi:hypothetical protein